MTKFEVVKDSGETQKFPTGAIRDRRVGKGRPDLIPPTALRRVARHYELGAVKYGDWNWAKGEPFSRFMESALRHLNEYNEGFRDEDHLSAATFNIMGIIHEEEMIERGLLPKELNDLPSFLPQDELKEEPKKRFKVALDIDSTLANIVPLLIEWVKKSKGQSLTHEEISCWQYITNKFALTHDEERDLFAYPWSGGQVVKYRSDGLE